MPVRMAVTRERERERKVFSARHPRFKEARNFLAAVI